MHHRNEQGRDLVRKAVEVKSIGLTRKGRPKKPFGWKK